MQEQGESTPQGDKDLPENTDKGIVWFLGTGDKRRFVTLCDSNFDLYGRPSSQLRRKCQYRVKYLKRRPQRLQYYFDCYFRDSQFLYKPGNSICSSVSTFASPDRIPSIPRTISPSPWSLPKPRNIMASFSAPEADDNNTFQLHFDDPARNPCGVFVVKRSDVSTGSALVGQITIYFSLDNVVDTNTFSARLSDDGSCLIVTDQAQPTPLVEDIKKLHHFTCTDDEDVDDKMILNTLSVQAEIVQKAKRNGSFNKDFFYKFPEGITCNSDHFNAKKKNQLGVESNLSLMPYPDGTTDDSGDAGFALMPTMKVRLAIDGDDRAMQGKDAALNEVQDAMAKMKLRMQNYKKG